MDEVRTRLLVSHIVEISGRNGSVACERLWQVCIDDGLQDRLQQWLETVGDRLNDAAEATTRRRHQRTHCHLEIGGRDLSEETEMFEMLLLQFSQLF